MLTKKVCEFLKEREFISVGTCDFEGRPNAAPKFLLKVEEHYVYLVDYSLTKTWENLKINPRVSLSFVDNDTLKGYQVNGTAEIISSGPLHEKLFQELREREISLSAKRIIEGIHRQKKHESYEVVIPERFAVFKVAIIEVTEIDSKGKLKKEKL